MALGDSYSSGLGTGSYLKDGTSCSNGGTCTSGKCVAPPAKEPAGPTEHSFMGCGMPGGSFEALAPLLLALIGIRRRR